MNDAIDHIDTGEYATVVLWSEHFDMAIHGRAARGDGPSLPRGTR